MELLKKPMRARELIAMIFMLIGIKGGDTTPSLFADEAQNALWIAPIVSFVVILPPFITLMYLLKKYQTRNLAELLHHLLGTKLGTIIGIFLFVGAFISMAADMRNIVEEINYLYFPNSPTIIIYLIFIVICLFVANKGLESIGSLAWAVLPVIVLTIISVMFVDFQATVWQRIFPILGGGASIVIRDGFSLSSVFLEFFLLTIAYQAFHDTKQFRIGMYTGSILSVLLIVLFYMIYTMVFDYNTVDNIAYLYQESTEIVPLGHFFTNISTFFMVGWLLSNFLRFTIFLYIICWLYGALFQIKRFEGLLMPISFLAMILSMIPPNFITNEMIVRKTSFHWISPIYLCFPFLLLAASLWRERRKL
ncbi:spore germination protein (amino acid permease) [Terribacillus halophilus]|uniref:Spore germination protein (Amino acid permease) n=1 Tax=Terribacillus halophilus TaxID=361279 RepID=A0A1G6M1K6_9BACI|nr:GerAB/ArcD/ProY family transporter [Terribacillus halophilus]SDC49349.1 spore germination protein (amino acid permease) [Terribacillus halophilus]